MPAFFASCCCACCHQVRKFESVNFLDFVQLLAAFSDRAPYEEKVKFVFRAYDVDGDGACAHAHMRACACARTHGMLADALAVGLCRLAAARGKWVCAMR